jgi:hypothetical protein
MNLKRTLGLYALLLIQIWAFTACSGGAETEIPEHLAGMENLTVIEPDADPLRDWDPVQVASYGDTDEVMLGQVGDFTADMRGRIYIADWSQNVIHAYQSDGEYITQVGGEGDGPGEFRRINAIRADDSYLHVLDTGHMRISRFNLETFRFTDNIAIPFEWEAEGGFISFPGNFDIIDSENYLIHFGTGYTGGQDDSDVEPKDRGRILNRESETFLDGTVYEFPISEAIVHREGTGMSVMSPEYKRRSVIMANGRYLAHGWSEDLLFTYYSMDGEYSHAFYQPISKPPLDRNEILREHADRDEPWRGMIRNDDMPETWPAYRHSVMDDENRIWAATYLDDDEVYNWRVFSSDGELMASFIWPRARDIRRVQNGAVYTRETDEETGLRQIVRYQLESI